MFAGERLFFGVVKEAIARILLWGKVRADHSIVCMAEFGAFFSWHAVNVRLLAEERDDFMQRLEYRRRFLELPGA